MKIARILTAILVAVVEGTAVDDAVTDERVVDAVAVERVAQHFRLVQTELAAFTRARRTRNLCRR